MIRGFFPYVLFSGSEFILENAKEHAPLSAGASVDHGVGVGITEEHVNRAADRGCCVSTHKIAHKIAFSRREAITIVP